MNLSNVYYCYIFDNEDKLIITISLNLYSHEDLEKITILGFENKNSLKFFAEFFTGILSNTEIRKKIERKEIFEHIDNKGLIICLIKEELATKIREMLKDYDDPYIAFCKKHSMTLEPSEKDTGLHKLFRKNWTISLTKRFFEGREFYTGTLPGFSGLERRIIDDLMDYYEMVTLMIIKKTHVNSKLFFFYKDVHKTD